MFKLKQVGSGNMSVIIKILGCDSNILIATSTRLFRLEVSPKVKHFVFRCKNLTTYTKKVIIEPPYSHQKGLCQTYSKKSS